MRLSNDFGRDMGVNFGRLGAAMAQDFLNDKINFIFGQESGQTVKPCVHNGAFGGACFWASSAKNILDTTRLLCTCLAFKRKRFG